MIAGHEQNMKPVQNVQICTGFIISTFHAVVYFNTQISKTCAKRPLSKRLEMISQDQLSLYAGQKYCRMLQESMLQYIRPTLSYHLSLRSLFCLFLSGRFTILLASKVLQNAPREHSAIHSTYIKLPFVIKIFGLSIFEWSFYTGFTV